MGVLWVCVLEVILELAARRASNKLVDRGGPLRGLRPISGQCPWEDRAVPGTQHVQLSGCNRELLWL
jgi:hypothetical protein